MNAPWTPHSRASLAFPLALLALPLVSVLALAACGGGNTASGTAPPAASPSSTASPSPAVSAASLPSALPRQTYLGTLVFTRITKPNRNYDIYLVRSDGTGLRRLTDGPGVESHAYWSPDGRQIVYDVYVPGHGGVWVMNADGSGKRELVGGGACLAHWSPDGRQIVYLGGGGISVVDADGRDNTCVVAFGSGRVTSAVNVMEKPVANPCWTPDGRIIFFSGWPSADLYVVNSDGSGLARLTKSAGLSEPAVSPDGTRLAAYVRAKDSIVSVPLDGDAAPVTLLDHARRHFPSGGAPIAAWTSDGRKLVLGGSGFGETRGSGLYIVNADGSGLTKIPNVTDAICANWRPR
jgi:hypothetical protein